EATPTAEPTGAASPTAIVEATTTPASTATPGPTPTPTSTSTPSPSPSSLPAAVDGSPYGGADLVAALAAADIGYGPQSETRTCVGAGAEAVVYGPIGYGGDPAWPEFTLWV